MATYIAHDALAFSMPSSASQYKQVPVPDEKDSRGDIVGKSRAIAEVIDKVKLVGPTDSTVLIEGETGTGKEVIAKALHFASTRRDAPFVKVNCAAIPAPLLESELFGHERGAYTGAIAQRIGRFEAASGGTLFLDEVGDLPLELQPKLLRVLQEREFERLGSSRTIRANVRVIAATNQDLLALVNSRQFRADLYYRLEVIKIQLPPLRDRADDVPLLARHFADRFARKMNKVIDAIPPEVVDVLKLHDWPGNIRELQNFIERAVIMSPGPILRPPLAELRHLVKPLSSFAGRTLAEAERDHILEALEHTGWMIGGFSGAAARLGLARTTLIYKMHELGIEPRQGRRIRAAQRNHSIERMSAANCA